MKLISWLRQRKSARDSINHRPGVRRSSVRVWPVLELLERRDVPAPLSSNIFSAANVNGTLFFGADDGVHGKELWKSDGTAAGTVLVKDINPGINGSVSNDLMNVGGTLFFSANDGVHGLELWKSDGTAAGTVLVKDILPGSGGNLFLALLGDINGRLFFSADDGVHGRELWTSDGTDTGTALFKDINPGLGSSNPIILTSLYPLVLKDANGLVYMLADDGTHGRELWRTDGTPDGTLLVKDINPGTPSSSPGNLAIVNGMPLFLANDGVHGNELWKSDGTADGTTLVKDINPGSLDSFPEVVRVVNGTMFFNADDGIDGRELWKSDGTADGTALVKDVFAGPSRSGPYGLTNVNGTLFFSANDGIHGRELWRSDGSADSTVLIKDITAGSAGSSGLPLFGDISPHPDGVLLFPVNDGVHGSELWRSNGDADGTFLVKDILSGSGSGFFISLAYVNGTLFFGADDGIHGTELWKSAGTEAGTVMVKDINRIGSPPLQILRNDSAQTTETVPTPIDILANDWFAEGTEEIITAVSAPAHGSAVLNADGTITYTSVASFSGVDSFTYTVTNNYGDVDTATVSVEVFPSDFVKDDYAKTSQDTPVTIDALANDVPTPGATITAVSAPAHGSAAVNADGSIGYTPAAGFYGTDSFTYTVSNAVGGIDTATVTVQVAQQVQIDIKPGDTTNAINLNNDGTITVAVFSTVAFDARTVDVASVLFAGASAFKWSLQDVNHDGKLDLGLQFRVADTNLREVYSQLLLADAGDGTLDTTRQQTSLLLTGSTTDGRLWEGLDAATLFETGKTLDDLLLALGLE